MRAAPVRIGFGRASLWGSWLAERTLADEIEVRALVACGADGPAALLAADVCGMWPATCLRLRAGVAAALDTDPARVGIFCTQNHGAPMEGPGVYDLERWENACRRAAAQAQVAARPAHMAVVEVHPAPAGVVNRRRAMAGLGRFTCWYGFERLPDGRTGGREVVALALRGLASRQELTVRSAPRPDAQAWPPPDLPVPELPATLPMAAAADTRLQALFFRTPEGQPIGTLSRWPAHPVTANLPGQAHSGDYPVYLRRELSRAFGGEALFLTGPCGDQAPRVGRKSLALAEEIGVEVAGWLLRGLETCRWDEVAQVRAASTAVSLPVRSDYPTSVTAARNGLEEARRRFRLAAELAERKRWSEEIERLLYTIDGHHRSWCGFRPEEAGGSVRHPLFALRLGPAVVAGLPGEPFGSYSRRLRAAAGGPLLVAEECNGYLSYIPAAADHAEGGYGPAAAILDPRAEDVLLQAAQDLVGRVRG